MARHFSLIHRKKSIANELNAKQELRLNVVRIVEPGFHNSFQ